jgi:hypothetical protein
MSHPIEHTTTTILGTATAASLFGMISQDSIVSIGAVVMTVGGLGIKLYSDFHARRRAEIAADKKAELDADMEELAARRKADLDGIDAWKKMIFASAEEVGDARVKIKEVEARAVAAAARASTAEARALELEQKVKALASSQNDVITAVNKQQVKAKDVSKRVDELEQAVGSSSNLELTPTPKAEDSTAIDIPTMG